MRTITLTATALIAAFAAAVPAQAAPLGLYRTDAQAERHIERTRGGSAFCINGYYSRHEKRTKRHFRQRSDERFRSFKCSHTRRDGRTVNLYLQTRPNGRWVVLPDR